MKNADVTQLMQDESMNFAESTPPNRYQLVRLAGFLLSRISFRSMAIGCLELMAAISQDKSPGKGWPRWLGSEILADLPHSVHRNLLAFLYASWLSSASHLYGYHDNVFARPMSSDPQVLIFSDFTRFKRHPQVVFSELDGEISLFQSRTCDYLVLNESGSAIWELLSRERTLNELLQSLCQQYHIEPDICRQDVRDWLMEACHRQVVLVLNPA